MGCVKGIPSDQIQDTIRRNGLTGGNRKGVESTLEIVLEDKGSRIAFTVAKELCERERERVIFRYQSGKLRGNGHTCQRPTMDANEVSLCNSI